MFPLRSLFKPQGCPFLGLETQSHGFLGLETQSRCLAEKVASFRPKNGEAPDYLARRPARRGDWLGMAFASFCGGLFVGGFCKGALGAFLGAFGGCWGAVGEGFRFVGFLGNRGCWTQALFTYSFVCGLEVIPTNYGHLLLTKL